METRLIDILEHLVSFNTESPPARNTDPLQKQIRTFLSNLNFNVKTYPLYPNDSVIVAVLKGQDSTAPKLILNGHVDVASVDDPKFWDSDPFTLVEKQHRLYGRGVSDMKGGMAALLCVVEQLYQEGHQPKGDIIIHSVVGEEVGEAGTKLACQHSPKADLALVLDTSDLVAQGQGGCITGWITIESPETVHDGNRINMVHAGGGLFAASAIEKMAKIIMALKELENHWAVIKSSPQMRPGVNTINPAVIEGGRNPAFIADQCRLWITVHYLPHENYRDIIEEVESYLYQVAQADLWLKDHPLKFEWGGASMIEDRGEIFPSFPLPTDHPGLEKLSQSYKKVYGINLPQSMSTSVTDGGWLHDFGIPTILFGPGEFEQAHSVNESIDKQDLLDFTQILYSFLLDWYRDPVK